MENQELLLITMAVFTGVAAVALVIQMAFLFGIYRSIKTVQQRSATFMDRWEPVADSSLQLLEQLRQQSNEILTRVGEVAETTKNQVQKVDSLLTDVSDRAKSQMDRVDRTVENALERVHETAAALQGTLLVPIRQLRALAVAVGVIFEHLFGSRRPTVDRATLDEEMFI